MTPEELDTLWQDPRNWWAFIYSCKKDPRIIVPMRVRWTGYSMNYAHTLAIPVSLAILAALLAPFLFLLLLDLPQSTYWAAGTFLAAVIVTTALCHWESTRSR